MKEKLGGVIREIREQRGLTQGELSQATGLSTSQISNIERGEFAPSVDALERIARALRVKLPQIFQFDLLEGDRSKIERQLKVIALVNSLKPADLDLAIGILQLLSRRSKADRST
jgi:transcriptional regulator with XRE-family HTH domain